MKMARYACVIVEDYASVDITFCLCAKARLQLFDSRQLYAVHAKSGTLSFLLSCCDMADASSCLFH